MSSLQNGVITNIQIFVLINGATIMQGDLVNFQYNCAINGIPNGSFIMIDRNNAFMSSANSGIYGRFYLSDTSDGLDGKASYIDFIIDELKQLNNTPPNVTYLIKWSAGTPIAINNSTFAFTGNSIEAINDIAKRHSYGMADYLTGNIDSPTDTMTWRFIQDNMWQQFDTVVSKSWLKGDYLFWTMDDVNNTLKVSSLNHEKSLEDKNVFVYSINAMTSTQDAITVVDNPSFTIWRYDKDIRLNMLGTNRSKLFPDVSFTGVVDTDLKASGYKKLCFVDMLKSAGDVKQQQILEKSALSDPTVTYGPLVVRRHFPNNVHKFYAGADVFREREVATYAKVMYLNVYNKVGPALGSKNCIIALSKDSKVSGLGIDETYSDNYILVEKSINFSTSTQTLGGQAPSGNELMVTTLKFVSDTIDGSGLESVNKILNQLDQKGKK